MKQLPILAAIGCGTGCLLLAANAPGPEEPKQTVQVSATQRVDFPPGGALRMKNSVGVLTVEAWDRSDMEITTIKSSQVELDARGRERAAQSLEKVRVAVERHGDEVVVTTEHPRGFPLPYPTKGEHSFELEYRIKAPANARFIDDHHDGDVNVDGLTGDIDVHLRQGQIMLHLPEDGKYSIAAKSDLGSVNSDFSELEKRSWWLLGHRSMKETPAPHKLNLKVGFGDIVLLKIRIPKAQESLLPAQKPEGQ